MSSDELVFVIVVAARLGIPLLIPRFPLPAILASLVIDAADQTIFQQLTDLNLDSYQGYDKALDVYYLTVAYLSTIRNWSDPFARRLAQFLWYYRLTGVMLFELTQARALLIIFPNTFEYFFIAFETVRLAWDPRRLKSRQLVYLAAFIWVFIKLPQEWWLHIAQLDFTDFMKEDVLGVSVDTSWGDALSQNLWFVALLLVVAVGIGFGIRAVLHRAPPPDWSFTFDVDRHLEVTPEVRRVPEVPILSWYVAEKVALIAMVTVIFAQVVPDLDASVLSLWLSVGFVVVVNAAASQWLSGRGYSWTSTARQFVAMLAVNVVIVLGYLWLLRRSDEPVNEAATVFFVLLLTLIVTMFDRYSRRRALVDSARSGNAGMSTDPTIGRLEVE